MRAKIPSTFQLSSMTVSVIIVPQAKWKAADCVGYWDPLKAQIVLLKQNPDVMWHTFWHEAVHAALCMMSSPLNDDEVFVDQLGGHFAQIIKSAK